MILSNIEIRDNLEKAATIFRKYDLGGRREFNQFFNGISHFAIEKAWEKVYYKIQNSEIIKDTNAKLNKSDIIIVKTRVEEITNKTPLYHYLNSTFDIKAIKLKEENIERRVRQILANKYLFEIKHDTFKKQKLLKDSIKVKFSLGSNKHKLTILILGFVCIFFIPKVIDSLSLPESLINKFLHKEYPEIVNNIITLDVLANHLHQQSRYRFNGAICNDGWTSHSRGSGTCSHHGGVNYYFDKGEYRKTYEECLVLAKKEILLLEKKQKAFL